MPKPLIAIGPHYLTNPQKKPVIGCYENYIRCLEKAGASTIILNANMSKLDRILELCDGLMLTGGDDIDPQFYKEKKLRGIRFELSPNERSHFDIKLVKKILKLNKAFLGICLGTQTLNIAQGGTLWQDIPKQINDSFDHSQGKHAIEIVESSQLAKILKKTNIKVNSRHHQAIKTFGRKLIPTAIASDGVVEGIESVAHDFAVGVQWHPEELKNNAHSKNLFKAFVKASKKKTL